MGSFGSESVNPGEEIEIAVLPVHRSSRKDPGARYESGPGASLQKEDFQAGPLLTKENESSRWSGVCRWVWRVVEGTEEPWG